MSPPTPALLAYRALYDALGLTEMAGAVLSDCANPCSDASPGTRTSTTPTGSGVGGRAATKQAASTSQMGRFETEWLANDENLVALADLSGHWIDRVHGRQPPRTIVLDTDSSVSPTYGDQEGTAYNGHFACTCYHPLARVEAADGGRVSKSEWGIGGQGVWLLNGEVWSGSDRSVDSRTAVAIDPQRKLLFFAVGNRISPHLILQKLAKLGAKDGMLLDGGNSSSMVIGKGARGVSAGVFSGRRPVATHFGVRARPLRPRAK